MRALVLFALAAASCAAQDPLVNLGRLSIARVLGREPAGADQFYGIRNAFDGGRNVINGINYSSWNSGAQAFVIVRFSRPVTVTGIVVEGGRSSWMAPPDSFTVQIRSDGPRGLFLSPSHGLEGVRTVYALPRRVERVREVMLLFQGEPSFEVDEIEILGPPPAGVDLTPVTPPLDADVARPADVNGPARAAMIRTLAGIELGKMRAAKKAQAWLELNRAADRVAELLRNDEALKPLADEATSLGVTIDWCEPGADWQAGTEGYEQYLKLSPGGPEADDAWWMSRLRNGPRCGDFEGTPEEYQALIQEYSDFLKRFPNSFHAPEARQRLEDAQKEYKASVAK